MKTVLLPVVALVLLIPGAITAQHNPYAGQEARKIKALSDDEVKQYLAGAGMGYARAAELNRYPGPMHVLEHAESLALSPQQRTATQRLMDDHKVQAREIGAKLVEAEGTLDHLFTSSKLEEASLARQIKAVATLQGEYRLSHLETHRRMRAILTAEQLQRYDRLRGYTSDQGGSPAPTHDKQNTEQDDAKRQHHPR